MSGWISLDRAITKHWLWQSEKFTKAQAWIDLLLCANHTPHKVLLKGVLIPVARGEQIRSQVTLAKVWNWDRKTVSRFLKLLEKDSMIATRSDHLTSYISICNYDSFQDNKKDNPHQKGQQKGQQAPIIEGTDNNGNKENNDNNIIDQQADDIAQVINHLNSVTSSKYKASTKSHAQNISARLDDYTVDDLKLVIDYKFNEWGSDPKMASYIRPQTLFQTGKFGGYLLAAKASKSNISLDFDRLIIDFNNAFEHKEFVPVAIKVAESERGTINAIASELNIGNNGFKQYFENCANNSQFDYVTNGVNMKAVGINYFLKEKTILQGI